MNIVLKQLKRFAKSTKGSISVEAIIILPILLWAVVASAVFFDLFRTKSNLEKAAFTISDALSRETNAITPDYVTNAHVLLEELAGISDDASMRISVVTWDEDDAEYQLNWSKFRGDFYQPMTQANMSAIKDMLPTMADQDTLILVESQYQYDPIYSTPENADEKGQWGLNLGIQNLKTFVFTRPRYAPQLVFSSS